MHRLDLLAGVQSVRIDFFQTHRRVRTVLFEGFGLVESVARVDRAAVAFDRRCVVCEAWREVRTTID